MPDNCGPHNQSLGSGFTVYYFVDSLEKVWWPPRYSRIVLTGLVRLKLEFTSLAAKLCWKRRLSQPMAGL